MRGISYLLLGAVFIVLIAVASINYFSYAFLSQIPSFKVETINNQVKNEMGVLGLYGSTLFTYSESGDTIVLDTLIVLLPDGSVYKVYQDLNIMLTSFSVTAINLASLGIIPPAGMTYEDLTFIFVDEDGTRYFIDDTTPELGDVLYSFDNVITDVPIGIKGEWEDSGSEDEFWMRPEGRGKGMYRIQPGIIYINDVPVEVLMLSNNRNGKGSIWDVAIIVRNGMNQEFLDMLKQIIMEKINNGEYTKMEAHGDHTEYELNITLSISGSFNGDTLFVWTGTYKVEVEVKNGVITEIEFEDD